ncbi:MAG TPA: fasciclin domain-containing protein, partial [Longimicrobiales bacterium]|nr:fasciclin domain-containing protein [Longimicrobiales bacterium]
MSRSILRFAAALTLPLAIACADAETPTAVQPEVAEQGFGPRPGQGDPADGPTLLDVAWSVNDATGEFSTLLFALEASGLDAALDGRRPFTVFAPTDEAFAALPDGVLDAVVSDPDLLRDVLLYHVTSGIRYSPSVVGSDEIEMLNGDLVEVSTTSEGAFVN